MANDGTILVTGAMGTVGSALVPLLTEKGRAVRALVHDDAKADDLREKGVDVVVGDMEEPETLPPAVEGVDAIYLLTDNSRTAGRQASNVIVAAKQAGEPFVVRQGAHGPEDSRFMAKHDQAEAKLGASGLPHTILRPIFFMQNTLMAADTVASEGKIYLPLGDGEISMIDARDVADVAAEVLTTDGHEGKTYVLTGPEAVTFHDVAAALSEVLGKEVAYVNVPPEQAKQAMTDMGLSEWQAEGYIELMKAFAENWGDDVAPDVERVLGRPARSIRQFAEDYASAFRAS